MAAISVVIGRDMREDRRDIAGEAALDIGRGRLADDRRTVRRVAGLRPTQGEWEGGRQESR